MIPFAPFEPDRSRFNPNASDAILNAVPTADGYGPFKDLSAISDALAATCVGAIFVQDSSNDFFIIAGTATTLYRFDSSDGSWDDISGSSAPFGVPDGDLWKFAIYGTKLVATNITDPVQVYDIDAAGTFADLTGSPPQAKHVWVANGYLVLANTNSNSKRVQWSGYEDITTWTVGEKGADYQDLPDGGEVSGGIGDELGAYVFQRDRIRRMQFAPGTQFAFGFQEVDNARGAVSPHGIIPIALNDFAYLSESGFYRAEANPIGAEKVNRYFFDDVDRDFLNQVQGIADPFNKMCWWLYTDSDASRKMIGYDWQLDRWTRSNANPTLLCSIASPAYTLEALDNVSASLDALPYSLDARIWSGGRPAFAAFDSLNKLSYFEGDNMAAVLETAEVELSPPRRAFVSGIRAMGDSDDYTAQVGRKDKHDDAVTWSSTISPSSVTGLVPTRSSGRLHKFRQNIAAGDVWTISHGVEPEFRPEGRR